MYKECKVKIKLIYIFRHGIWQKRKMDVRLHIKGYITFKERWGGQKLNVLRRNAGYTCRGNPIAFQAAVRCTGDRFYATYTDTWSKRNLSLIPVTYWFLAKKRRLPHHWPKVCQWHHAPEFFFWLIGECLPGLKFNQSLDILRSTRFKIFTYTHTRD